MALMELLLEMILSATYIYAGVVALNKNNKFSCYVNAPTEVDETETAGVGLAGN